MIALAWPGLALAYSSPSDYELDVLEGGSGGRWFTGSPAEGYGCDACHEGGEPVDLEINGLPLDGYSPGSAHEITIRWPATAPHVALVMEFSTEARTGAGTLAPPASGTAEDLCTADELAGTPPIAIATDNLTASGRMFGTVIDCGAARARFVWTAPPVPSSDVWFSLGFVVSNTNQQPAGDGVTVVSLPLPANGSAEMAETIAQGCGVAATQRGTSIPALCLGTLLLLWWVRVARRERDHRR